MMTIVTHVELKPGTEREWDRAMHERLRVGTWKSREHWEAWHRDPAFRETRTRLDGLEARAAQEWWHQVVEERGLAA